MWTKTTKRELARQRVPTRAHEPGYPLTGLQRLLKMTDDKEDC